MFGSEGMTHESMTPAIPGSIVCRVAMRWPIPMDAVLVSQSTETGEAQGLRWDGTVRRTCSLRPRRVSSSFAPVCAAAPHHRPRDGLVAGRSCRTGSVLWPPPGVLGGCFSRDANVRRRTSCPRLTATGASRTRPQVRARVANRSCSHALAAEFAAKLPEEQTFDVS